MSFILNDEEHKALLESLFEHQKNIEKIDKTLNTLGIEVAGCGLFDKLYCLPFDVVCLTSPQHLSELDSFFDDFLYLQDFEKFYEKYFTKKEF